MQRLLLKKIEMIGMLLSVKHFQGENSLNCEMFTDSSTLYEFVLDA